MFQKFDVNTISIISAVTLVSFEKNSIFIKDFNKTKRSESLQLWIMTLSELFHQHFSHKTDKEETRKNTFSYL